MAERGEVAHDHAEAVVVGHREDDRVVGGVGEQLGDEVPVVEDVVVGEGDPLGKARRPRGVLDVDRIVGRELAGGLLEAHRVLRAGILQEASALVEQARERLALPHRRVSDQRGGNGVDEDEVEVGDGAGDLGGQRVEVRVRRVEDL
ncbi:Uncharacterised protein [Mycobacteroides abscessus subsp. abscessus]|nr:Uncharacterised protein [Mycobacteroides abscessus subsp. abscessus]